MSIDVVTTAIRRPEIFKIALRGYFGGGLQNLPKVRLILNIDPIGNGDIQEMVDMAREYVDEVVVRVSLESNFAAAVNWAWSQVETEYFLHLEDDWLFRRPIDFALWLDDLTRADSGVCQSVLLRKNARTQNFRFSFRAGLAKKLVIEKVLPIPLDSDPEKYVANTLGEGVSKDYGLPYQLIDMGRKWAKGQSYRKAQCDDRMRLTDGLSGQAISWYQRRSGNYLGKFDYSMSRIYWKFVQSKYLG